jgi:hypothetical protein
LATERSLAEARLARKEIILATTFNAEAIIEASINIEQLEDGLKRLYALKTELF